MTTSVGAILINQALPEELRRDQHDLDKKGIHKLLQTMAEKYPDQFAQTLKGLNDVGRDAGWTEGVSVSLSALRTSPAKQKILAELNPQIAAIRDDDALSDKERADKMVKLLVPYVSRLQDDLMEESKRENSPYHMQIVSGARGKKSDLASLRGADLLVEDQTGKMLPIPLLRSYAEGFKPADYFAASYGQRKGAISVKMGVADAGYIGKEIIGAAHRMLVTKEKPDATRLPVGIPFKLSDKDILGSVLVQDVGDHKAGTIITPKVREELLDQDHDEVLVHSPLTEPSEDGGISKWAAGRRDRVGLNNIGDNIGISSAQAISERMAQGLLNAKHSAGVSDRVSRSGVEYLFRLLGAPEHFPEAGPLAEEAGHVESVRKADQGGHYVKIGKKEYYLNPDSNPIVKQGDTVDRGDDLSDAIPHPAQLVKLRGMGEARRVYSDLLHQALNDSGVEANKRNVQNVVAGLMNWARVTNPDGIGDNVVDDVVPFNRVTYHYKPRPNAQLVAPNRAVGKYLDEPALHYTPGTFVTKKVADHLDRYGVKDVHAHDDPPDFEPHFVRSVLSVYHDPDWQTRLSGFYTSSAFQKSVHQGLTSDRASTSFVPALAHGAEFGKNLSTTGKYGG